MILKLNNMINLILYISYFLYNNLLFLIDQNKIKKLI